MVNLRQLLISILIAATLVASSAFAQTNLTQILDTITNPNGTPFNGTVVITWNGYSGSGSGTVSRLSTSAQVYNGALSVLLVPTTTASPGTYYQVVYTSSNGTTTWTETWQVPPSNTALTVTAVRQSSTEGSGSGSGSGNTGSGGGQYATLPIAINEITGLATSLSTINNSLSTVQSSVTTLGTSVAGLTSTVNSTAASVTSLNSTVGSLSSTVTTQGNSLTSLSSTVGGLNSTVSGQSASILGLTSSLSSLTTTVAGNTSSLTSVNSTVGGLSTNVTNLTNEVNGLSATVNSLSSSGSTAVFVDDQVPTGAINGTNKTFSLVSSPAPSTSLSLYRNGLVMSPGVDYTLSGSVITFLAASTPQSGDLLLAYYRTASTGGTSTNFSDDETPAGTINGTNVTYTLAAAPNPVGSLRLYRNGLLLEAGVEYTLSGSVITFTASRTPQTGDTIVAFYRH